MLEIYYLLYHTRIPGDHTQELYQLKQLILDHAADFSADEAYDLYTGALNNLSRQRQIVGQVLLQEIFTLYQSMVDVYARDGA